MLVITDSVSGSMCTSLTPVALCIDVPGGEPFRLLDGAVWQYLDGPKITCNRIEHNRRCSFRINVGRPENKIRLVHMEETSTAMHQWECSDCSIHICNSCVTALLLMTQMITNLQVIYSMLHLFDVSVYTVPDLDDIYNWLRNLLRDDNYLSRLTVLLVDNLGHHYFRWWLLAVLAFTIHSQLIEMLSTYVNHGL